MTLADPGVHDSVLPAALLAGARNQVVPVPVVAGVHRDGDERERDRRALAEDVEDVDQRPAVLAARQPDHHAVAILDQVVVGDRLGDLLGQACFERGFVGHGFDSTTAAACDPNDSRSVPTRSSRRHGGSSFTFPHALESREARQATRDRRVQAGIKIARTACTRRSRMTCNAGPCQLRPALECVAVVDFSRSCSFAPACK